MKVSELSNESIVARIGNRLECLRINSDLQDSTVIQKGGIKKDAWYNLKGGRNITLMNLIKALRGLDALELLDNLALENGEETLADGLKGPSGKKRKIHPKRSL
jgi:hypothetical protein